MQASELSRPAERLPVSVVIPTLGRERVLVDTVGALLLLSPAAAEILVVDQTPLHDAETETWLGQQAATGAIRWIRLTEPSIPAAMNQGLLLAREAVVLFLDDDIIPSPGLVSAHWVAHQARRMGGLALVAGRVLQPWHADVESPPNEPFHFASTRPCEAREFIGANFSVDREFAISLGGFDENFVRVAYRFEAEFSNRVLAAGRSIRYEPAAWLRHLKAGSGGTRSYGNHLETVRPDHAVGAYYFALCAGRWRDFLHRPVRSVVTRFHLRHPWFIPVSLVAEIRGMVWAWRLYAGGPRRLSDKGSQGV